MTFSSHLLTSKQRVAASSRVCFTLVESALLKQNVTFHKTSTVVAIEGPRVSTRAESKMFRLMGADIINISIATEATLTNEVGISSAAVAMSIDYDCWKEVEEPVSWDAILEVFKGNADKVTRLLLSTIPMITDISTNATRATRQKRSPYLLILRIDMNLLDYLPGVPDFPKPGTLFRDISPLIANPAAFKEAINQSHQLANQFEYTHILEIESHGFIFGSALAHHAHKGLVLARKPNKPPLATHRQSYGLEYGKDSLEMQQSILPAGSKFSY